jgi:hypothetical protein
MKCTLHALYLKRYSGAVLLTHVHNGIKWKGRYSISIRNVLWIFLDSTDVTVLLDFFLLLMEFYESTGKVRQVKLSL